MIGNDLVLFQNDSISLDRLSRKFEKILQPSEQVILKEYFNAKHFSIIWSIKEAGYKAMQRNFKFKMKFNPHEMQIISYALKENTVASKLCYANTVIEITSIFTQDLVYSFTGKNVLHNFNFSVSSNFRNYIQILQYEPISLVKDKLGLPHAERSNSCIPISKTHDRDFIAYCWEME